MMDAPERSHSRKPCGYWSSGKAAEAGFSASMLLLSPPFFFSSIIFMLEGLDELGSSVTVAGLSTGVVILD